MSENGEGKLAVVRMDDDSQAAVRAPDGTLMPAVVVGWDEKCQSPVFKFDPRAFRSWEFIEAVLTMAAAGARETGRLMKAAKMQQAQMEAQSRAWAEQKLVEQIIRGK